MQDGDMDRALRFRRIAPRLAVILMAGASLAACASTGGGVSGPIARSPTTREPPASAFKDPATGQLLRGTMKPYQVRGVWYTPAEQPDYDEVGIGSWYGEQFHNRQTSNGENFDMDLLSAAHKTLPLPSMVEVTNLDNGRKMVLRVNDRGPFVDDRIIDLSRAAADQLGYRQKGVARVRVRYLGPASKQFDRVQTAAYTPPKALDPVPERPIEERFPIRRAPPSGPVGVYRIQAGAFSNIDNAQRAVDQISSTGSAVIEPIDRNGATLYRVLVGQAADEAQAWTLRDRVAALGFRDASILRP
jgi:rare lipoprotein A